MKIIFVRLTTLFLFVCSALLFITSSANASTEFETSYDVLMEAYSTGKMHVQQKISLKNNLSNLYASSYTLKIDKGAIENITASDSQGTAKTAVSTENDETTITVNFNDQIVGLNKTLNFTLSYETSDLIRKSGQVWELTIPRLSNPESIDSYNLTVKVPVNFGNPAYISPPALSQKTDIDSQTFIFSKNQVAASGIIAAFGEFQIYDFSLKFNLENPNNEKYFQVIALPPDTAYQKIKYYLINPEPLSLEADKDGNWLAKYELKAREKLTINASGQVKIFANPVFELPSLSEDKQYLLKPAKYWETNDPDIQKVAQTLKTARDVHEYVVKTLQYDYSRARVGAQRMGAAGILKDPERAICMEYTDLFVTLARAIGIPARELNGYAYTDNPHLKPLSVAQDVLHAWPEYFDQEKNTWIQVDPTWENTTGGVNYFDKLDQDHFVFVIHGENSAWPIPAGAYKNVDNPDKNLQINFGRPQEEKYILPDIEFVIPEKITSEKSSSGQILIKNSGYEALYDLNISITGVNLNIARDQNQSFKTVLPFSSLAIPIQISSFKQFYQGKGQIKILLNNREQAYNVTIVSIILAYIMPLFGGLLAATTLFIIARKIWRLYLQRR
jgi:transglutaminase-like putative cysteine protease